MQKSLPFLLVISAVILFSSAAMAEDYTITLKDKQFFPSNLTVPANQKIKLTVKNLDAVTAEFESDDLDREKVVEANGAITVFIGPLDAGSYSYINDFDHSATGTITAK